MRPPSPRALRVCFAVALALVGLLFHGALIEVLQGFTGYRQADWLDFVADAAGAGLAALIVAAWRQRDLRAASRPGRR